MTGRTRFERAAARVIALVALGFGLAVGIGFADLGGSDPSNSVAAPRIAGVVNDSGTGAFDRIPAITKALQPAIVSVLVDTTRGRAEGSGVVWDGVEGLVVTNNHVIEGAREIEVVLRSGRRLSAEVREADPLTDIAVVAVDEHDLPSAEFAEELPRVGELALALGNPLGFDNSVTAGIVSGLHRSIPSGGQTPALIDLIQTDTPISPGNSGGALVDRGGKVIGLNVAFIPPQARAVSIGFAIPSPTMISVVEQLLETGEAEHAFLGVQPANLTAEAREQLGIEAEEGVAVVSVTQGSAADEAGLRRGDVIVGFNGRPTRIIEDLFSTLRHYKPGDRITLTVLRDGEPVKVAVTLSDRPGS